MKRHGRLIKNRRAFFCFGFEKKWCIIGFLSGVGVTLDSFLVICRDSVRSYSDFELFLIVLILCCPKST